MPHKPWKLLLVFWAMSLALAIVCNAQETLQPYAPPILHSFLDSANVYPESVVSSQFYTAGSPAAVSGTQPPVVPFWVTEMSFGRARANATC
jgi:hypothetical protein